MKDPHTRVLNPNLHPNLRALLESEFTSVAGRGRACLTIHLPKGGGSFELSPEQAVAMKIEPHGNYGRSLVTFQLTVVAQVEGKREELERWRTEALLEYIRKLEQERDFPATAVVSIGPVPSEPG